MEEGSEWEKVEAGLRRRRKHKERDKKKKEEDEKEKKKHRDNGMIDEDEEKVVSGFVCGKCGKMWQSKKGGWYKRHVISCSGKRKGLEENRKRVNRGRTEGIEKLKCTKCGKEYRSEAWYRKHIDIDRCGSSYSME